MISYRTVSTLVLFALTCLFAGLTGCASIDHQLTSNPEIVDSYKTADSLADLEKLGKHHDMLAILKQEEQDAVDKADRVKRLYVLNEMAYVYYNLMGDYHNARRVNTELESLITASSGQSNTPYTDLPRAVKDGRKVLQTIHYDYFRQFRNISQGELQATVKQRKEILSHSLSKSEAFKEEAISSKRAEQVVKKLQQDSKLSMPITQRTANQFRLAYAMLFIPSQFTAGLDLLDRTLSSIDPNWKNSPELMDKIYPYLSPMQFVKVCMRAGKISQKIKKDDEAIEYNRVAIDELEQLRIFLKTEQERIHFFSRLEILYGRMVKLLVKQDTLLAFTYAERAKSRTLADILSQRLPGQIAGGSQSNPMHYYAQFQNQANDTWQQQSALDNRSIKVLKKDKKTHKVVAAEIKQADPELFSLMETGSQDNFDPGTVFASNEAYLSFYSFKEYNETIAFYYSNGKLRVHHIPLGYKKLTEQMHELQCALGVSEQQCSSKSTRLSVAPYLVKRGLIVKNDWPLTQAEHLYISPHGPLHFFPFALLKAGKRYLADTSFSIIPGVNSYRFIKEKSHPNKKNQNIFALSNPEIPAAIHNLYESLPGTEEEVEEISTIFGKRVSSYSHEQATETLIKKQGSTLRNSGVLHIASHGVFNEYQPMNSHLVLAEDNQNDGLLTAMEVMALDLSQINLVILSACESGKGKHLTGDEVLGMNRAFFRAGTPNIISSLWKVDDAATAFFMKQFYTSFSETADPSSSIQYAYTKTRQIYPQPFFWAAFQLNGVGH